MKKTVKKYIEILYSSGKDLSEEDRKQREKDEQFLTKFLEQFEKKCNKCSKERTKYTDYEFYKIIISMVKEEYDPETIIVDYVEGMLEAWDTNDFTTEKIDELIALIKFGYLKGAEYEDIPIDNTPITLEQVYKLTEEFLEQIDEEGNLLNEFKKLKANDKIEIMSQAQNGDSYYSSEEQKIYYNFNGTVNSANTLVHEFMHHICVKEANTNMEYNNFTLFREFLNIYYENAFIKFMDEKGLLPNGQTPLLAKRFRKQKERDPNNCLEIYLELGKEYKKNNGKLDKENILLIASKFFPNIKDEECLWEHASSVLTNFTKKNKIGMETGAGLTTYRFSTALSHATIVNSENNKNMFKMAKCIRNGTNDIEAFNYYLDQVGKTEQEFFAEIYEYSKSVTIKPEVYQITVDKIGKRTVKNWQTQAKRIITKILAGTKGVDIKDD